MVRVCIAILLTIFLVSVVIAEDDDDKFVRRGDQSNRLVLKAFSSVSDYADYATIKFTISAVNDDAKDAHRMMEKRLDSITKVLNIPSIAPEGSFSVTLSTLPTTMRYEDKEGYTYSKRVIIRVNNIRGLPEEKIHQRITGILDDLNTHGLGGDLTTIRYDVADPEALSARAYELAIKDARERAKAQIGHTGRKLGRIMLLCDQTYSVKAAGIYATTDASSFDPVVERKVALYVEFELE